MKNKLYGCTMEELFEHDIELANLISKIKDFKRENYTQRLFYKKGHLDNKKKEIMEVSEDINNVMIKIERIIMDHGKR